MCQGLFSLTSSQRSWMRCARERIDNCSTLNNSSLVKRTQPTISQEDIIPSAKRLLILHSTELGSLLISARDCKDSSVSMQLVEELAQDLAPFSLSDSPLTMERSPSLDSQFIRHHKC